MLRAVRESVDAGEYASTSDVMEAVLLWQRQHDAERLDAIRARIRRWPDHPRPDQAEEIRLRIEGLL